MADLPHKVENAKLIARIQKLPTYQNSEVRVAGSGTGNSSRSSSSEIKQPSKNSTSPESSSTDNLKPAEAARASGMLTSSGSSPSNTSPASTAAAQNSTGAEFTGPSPYGTRSRNRSGNVRPNYAEDRENEMDYEWSSGKKSQSSAAVAGQGTKASEVERSAQHQNRKVVAANGEKAKPAGSNSMLSKEALPGTSMFSVNSDGVSQTQSKKRKAGQSGLAGSSSAQPAPNPAASTRKAAQAVPASSTVTRDTNMVSFENCQGYLSHGCLVADDKTRFRINDTVYLVCEPPGEPYYLARIMEFLHAGNNSSGPVESLRINWIYRPRDIGRKATDTRLVFASMHSDTCPLTSLRGKCNVQHRSRIADLEKYRKEKDSFYYTQMYERYIHRYYDVIPTSQVINVPEKVKKALDERWQFVIVESGRAKELTSAIKTCKRCANYCASNDSVDCAMCKNTYHMNCVQPPLAKKPARGFAWSCGPCSRKQEKKLEARNTPLLHGQIEGEEDENFDEEEEDHAAASNHTNRSTPGAADLDQEVRAATKEQLAQAKLWPYRYFGIHCENEDALDYDDRIYPRASSRLGPRHQANVLAWHGHKVEYVKPAEIKKKYIKGNSHKKDAKLSKETIAAIEADKVAREKRPKWVIDEPPGYVHRALDLLESDVQRTSKTIFKLPQVGERSSRGGDDHQPSLRSDDKEQILDNYMAKAKKIAPSLGLEEYSTNLLDKAIELLYANKFNAEAALKQLQNVDTRKDLKEPRLTKDELKRFEEAVAKYGSNLGDISRHVGKSVKHGDIVRFYYIWKKTEKGKQIWGSYEGRKSKKQAKQSNTALLDDVADDYDDSAFDNDKAAKRKRGFECKFCFTRSSRFWRRAPQTAPGTTVPAESGARGNKDKGNHLMVALCQRCAGLWRRYAIQWENIDEVAKKVAQTGGRAFKRKLDEELLIELVNANEASSVSMSMTAVQAAQSLGIEVSPSLAIQPEQEGSRKKAKVSVEKEPPQPPTQVDPPKKKVVEKPPEPPPVPEQPKMKVLKCMVCLQMDPQGDEHFCCRHCRLTVHRNCYGIPEGRSPSKWLCDMCLNDSTNQYSTNYQCILCPCTYSEFDLMEAPKTSHKKKTDREREKERYEKELVVEATNAYHRKQEELGREINPRQPLKPTSGNHWMHVTCAVWTPWIKFRDAKLLDKAEGMLSIPRTKFKETCDLCKLATGVLVSCHKCPTAFHVTCAQLYDYPMGFEVTPVKGSRRDVVNSIAFGSETGNVEAVVYCREHRDHALKDNIHSMDEIFEDGKVNALQVFVRNFKQADSSLTGTVRKAAIVNSTRPVVNGGQTSGQRGPVSNNASNTASSNAAGPITRRSSRVSPAATNIRSEEVDEDGDRIVYLESTEVPETKPKICRMCYATSTPKWHKDTGQNGMPALGIDFSNDTKFLCHKCHYKVLEFDSSRDEASDDLTKSLGRDAKRMINQHPTGLSGWSQAQPPVPPVANDWQRHRSHQAASVSPMTNGARHTPPPSLHAASHPAAHPGDPYAQRPPPSRAIPHSGDPYAPTPTIRTAAQTDACGPLQPQTRPPFPATDPYRPPPANRPTSQPGDIYGPPRAPPPQYYANGYDRRDPPPMSHQQNGGPPSHYMSQRPSGPVEHMVYQQPPHHSPHHSHRMMNGANSPATSYPIGHGPSGPPRAAENPFFVPNRSPREQPYHQMHGSPRPRTSDGRPETPRMANGRTGGWERDREREKERERDRLEGQTMNGASASPNLRNLIH